MAWRSELEFSGVRQRLVNNIMSMMKLQYTVLTPERLHELQISAVTFEQNVFVGATTQSDYLEEISLKMQTEAKKNQNTGVVNSLPPNPPRPAKAKLGQKNTVDWQEEAYQKIKAMKGKYLPDLLEMHKNISLTLEQDETVVTPERMEKLRLMKIYIERITILLQASKCNIPISHRDKLDGYESRIMNFVNSYRIEKPVSANQITNSTSGGHPLLPQ